MLLIFSAYFFVIKERLIYIKKPCVGVLVRNNKFLKNVYTGFIFLIPFIDKLYFVDTEEKNICYSQSYFTKDNKNLNLIIELTYSITYPEKTILYTPTVVDEIEFIIKDSLEKLVNELTSEEIIEKKNIFCGRLLGSINNSSNQLGVSFTKAELTNLSLRIF